jgi:hypothetical protein
MMGFVAFIGFASIGIVAIHLLLKWLMEND